MEGFNEKTVDFENRSRHREEAHGCGNGEDGMSMTDTGNSWMRKKGAEF